MSHTLTRRVLARLEKAEAKEPNPHFRHDYRIAWITALRAGRGEARSHISATYAVLGLHPNKVWPAILARRKALLGASYDTFMQDGFPAPSSPKKPVQSVRSTDGKAGGQRRA